MDENNKYLGLGCLTVFFGLPGIICIIMGVIVEIPENGDYRPLILGIFLTAVAVLPWVGMTINNYGISE